MTENRNGKWAEMLGQLSPIVGLTSGGEIFFRKKPPTAEDFIVTSLVAQFVAHKAGKASKETLSINELISAGGLAYRPARQTIYNSTSGLAKNQIILKEGNEFRVPERVVVQYLDTKLAQLTGEATRA